MAKKVDLGFGARKNKETVSKNSDMKPKKTESAKSENIDIEKKENRKEINLAKGVLPQDESVRARRAPQRTKFVEFSDIYVNEMNDGMSMEDIDQLAESIYQVGLQQPLLVLQDEVGKYRLISGHRRYRAIEMLIKESKWNGKVECKEADLDEYDISLSDDAKELYLLLSGNINREKTASDRLFEMQGWQKVYNELKKNGETTYTGMDGIEYALKKSRDFISNMTGMSGGDLARLKKIENNGSDELLEAINRGELSVRAASDIASYDEDKQRELVAENQKKKDEMESVPRDTKSDGADSNFNFDKKVFNQSVKPIKQKIKDGINLTEEDMQEYKACIDKIIKILEAY